MCFGMRRVVLYKSRDGGIVQDGRRLFIAGGKDNGGVGRKKDIYTQVSAISWFNL